MLGNNAKILLHELEQENIEKVMSGEETMEQINKKFNIHSNNKTYISKRRRLQNKLL